MKIDHTSVERFNNVDTGSSRQGSRQAEQTGQKSNQVSVRDSVKDTVKDQVEKKVKEKQVERVQDKETDIQELKEAIDQANKSFKPMNRRFEYSIHDALPRVSVKVIDSLSDEVIREIPSEKLLDMVANMLEVAGIMIDDRG